MTTIPLILKAEPVSRLDPAARRSRQPNVAVVYATGDGTVDVLDGGRPMRFTDQLAGRYRYRYEVDMSDHHRTVELRTSPPPAKGGVHHFIALVDVGFRVTDPAQVVRRNIADALRVVSDHLIFVLRNITVDFSIEAAKQAEDAINAHFLHSTTIEGCIELYRCRARLAPDPEAASYLRDELSAHERNLVRDAEHELEAAEADRTNRVELIRQRGSLEQRRREREALGGRPFDMRDLLALHIERHPEDTEQTLRIAAEIRAQEPEHADAVKRRLWETLESMVDRGLARAVDVDQIRDRVVGELSLLLGTPPAEPRHVNTVIHHGGTPVGRGEILAADRGYVLGIGVGSRRADSLLGGDTTVPDELLARVDRRLDIYMRSHGLPEAARTRAGMFLPARGGGFTCRHTNQLDHGGCPAGSHDDLCRIPFRSPAEPQEFGFTVLIYAGAALIHAQEISLSTGTGRGAAATVTFRLQEDLSALPDLTDRAASATVGANTLIVNGVDGQPFEFDIGDAQWSHAAAKVRRVLTDIYLDRDPRAAGGWRPRFPFGTGVSPAAFAEHAGRLAVRGYRLFCALFPGADGRVLPAMLGSEAVTGVPVVQVARTVRRPFAVPWPVIYTLPVIGAEPTFWQCRSLAEHGPGGGGAWPPPPRCPYEPSHRRPAGESVLCPYGFWGLAHILEVPEPPRDRGVDEIVTTREVPPAVAVATGTGLDHAVRNAHLATLHRHVPGFPGAFLAAGAQGVLAPLWAVSDASTEALMRHFYLALQKFASPADALRQAQQAMAADPSTAHPYHWAGFQLFGAPATYKFPGAS